MEWFNNTRRLESPKESTAGDGLGDVQRLLTKPDRRKQAAHIFSALFYETHVKPSVDYSAYLASLAPGANPMPEFAYRNSCTLKAWRNAPPDIHKQVMEYKKLSEMSLEELEDVLNDDEENGKQSLIARSTGIPHSHDIIARSFSRIG